MKPVHSLLLICTLLFGTASAQYLSDPYRTNSWLSAHRVCLGNEINAGWMLDMMSDGMEVCVSPDGALVMVDRQPSVAPSTGASMMGTSYFDMSGTRLTLQSPIELLDDNVEHGFYTGTLHGTEVAVDQYVQTSDGSPVTVTRIIRRRSGSRPISPYNDPGFVLALMDNDTDQEDGSVPMLTLMDR